LATNLRPLAPPLTQKMLDDNGIVTPPWANFFNNLYRFQKLASVADGTYTLGTGTTDGEITLTSGVITAVQEVV